jgi:hypothetical protein
VACRCAPRFYLAKPHDAGNVRLSSCSSVSSNASRGFGWRIHCGVEVTESSTNKQHTLSHDLGDNKGRFECVFSGGALHDYTLNSTCIVCPAGKVRAAAGTSSLSPQDTVRNEHSLASYMCSLCEADCAVMCMRQT